MIIGAEGAVLRNRKTYLVDALRFALSISPYSVPCDQNLGIELKRVSNFEDSTVYKVKKIVSYIDPSGLLSCDSASLSGDQVSIDISFTDDSDTYYQLSLTDE